jgi:hypothetical protein
MHLSTSKSTKGLISYLEYLSTSDRAVDTGGLDIHLDLPTSGPGGQIYLIKYSHEFKDKEMLKYNFWL